MPFLAGGVEQRAINSETSVLDHERDFVGTTGKVEGVFLIVANHVEVGQSGIDIETSDAESMIVIPEHAGGLLVRVVGGIGARDGAGFAIGGEPGVGVAVTLRQDLSAVNVRHGADFRNVFLGAVDGVVDGKEVFGGQLVGPFDGKRLAFSHFEGWTRPHADTIVNSI